MTKKLFQCASMAMVVPVTACVSSGMVGDNTGDEDKDLAPFCAGMQPTVTTPSAADARQGTVLDDGSFVEVDGDNLHVYEADGTRLRWGTTQEEVEVGKNVWLTSTATISVDPQAGGAIYQSVSWHYRCAEDAACTLPEPKEAREPEVRVFDMEGEPLQEPLQLPRGATAVYAGDGTLSEARLLDGTLRVRGRLPDGEVLWSKTFKNTLREPPEDGAVRIQWTPAGELLLVVGDGWREEGLRILRLSNQGETYFDLLTSDLGGACSGPPDTEGPSLPNRMVEQDAKGNTVLVCADQWAETDTGTETSWLRVVRITPAGEIDWAHRLKFEGPLNANLPDPETPPTGSEQDAVLLGSFSLSPIGLALGDGEVFIAGNVTPHQLHIGRFTEDDGWCEDFLLTDTGVGPDDFAIHVGRDGKLYMESLGTVRRLVWEADDTSED